jgi:hypothetical protein
MSGGRTVSKLTSEVLSFPDNEDRDGFRNIGLLGI